MWRVKICGSRRAGDIDIALDAGADAVGLIVGVRHLSEDALAPDRARALLERIPRGVMSVLVTHLVRAQQVLALHEQVPTAMIQLHDEIAPADIRRIRRALPRVALIKAVHVTGPQAIAEAEAVAREVDALLLDSRTAERIGGTGAVHDWSISADVVRAIDRPVILAGGLTPENVAEAIAAVQPFGVDVNSGVDGTNGDKDRDKAIAFVQRARAALPALPPAETKAAAASAIAV
ncbi:MAG: phosphoribosylanthranilate isomerase [Rhodospirillales bacterium]|nr:phosphoribosylanthranilate isomerase [Rhodospirillales bacterium]